MQKVRQFESSLDPKEKEKSFGIKINPKKNLKMLMTDVLEHMDLEGIDQRDLMDEIKDIIRKTVTSIQSNLTQEYKSLQPRNKRMDMCFEILGFDILVDDYGQPWLIEVNHAPSFGTGSNLDKKVKDNLIKGKLNPW